MLVRILHDQCDYGYRDIEYVGLPGDRHNARVMYRLGLIDTNDIRAAVHGALLLAGVNARKLDSTFGIGVGWCKVSNPACDGGPDDASKPCPMLPLCPKVGV